jgi:hypothetical protein
MVQFCNGFWSDVRAHRIAKATRKTVRRKVLDMKPIPRPIGSRHESFPLALLALKKGEGCRRRGEGSSSVHQIVNINLSNHRTTNQLKARIDQRRVNSTKHPKLLQPASSLVDYVRLDREPLHVRPLFSILRVTWVAKRRESPERTTVS